MSERDKLAKHLADSLNKSVKGKKIAYFLDKDEETPTNVSEWVSTGSSMLDLAISNRKEGGIPVGKITEITGLESSGKSLVAAHFLAEIQKKGGIAVFIDTESALSREFLHAIGVDTSTMVYAPLDTVEEIYSFLEKIISTIREQNKDVLVGIVIDSMAAATTQNEAAADYEKEGWPTDKAIINSKALRKITNTIARQRVAVLFTNQLRQKMGVMFGDPWTTSGGKALAFHSSVRIRLKAVGQIKAKRKGREEIVGIKTRARVIKNRVGPPLREAEFDMFFDRGIDDADTWLNILKGTGIMTQAGAWYTIVDHKNEKKKFQRKEWNKMLENDEFRDYVYNVICDAVVMKYKSKVQIGTEMEVSDEDMIGEND